MQSYSENYNSDDEDGSIMTFVKNPVPATTFKLAVKKSIFFILKDPLTLTLTESAGQGLFINGFAQNNDFIGNFNGEVVAPVDLGQTYEDAEYAISLCTCDIHGRSVCTCKILQCKQTVATGLCIMSRANSAAGLFRADGSKLGSADNNCKAVFSNGADGKLEVWLQATRDIDATEEPVEILWPYGAAYFRLRKHAFPNSITN